MSKKMSYLLRHGAVKEKLAMTSDGFVSFEDLTAKTGIPAESILEVVKLDEKQRYAVQEINGKRHVRANQGHSILLEDLELKKVINSAEIPMVVHGTYGKPWEIIKTEGLSKMGRNHIHFAYGTFADKTVISGMRRSADVYVYIDAEKAMNDGIEFYLSANGVILTSGDARGYISTKYFAKAVTSKGAILEFNPDSSPPVPLASSPPVPLASSSEPFEQTII